MRTSVTISLILFVAMFFTSCIELEEALIVRHDRSGKLTYSLGIGQAEGLLGLISGFIEQPFESKLKDEALVWVDQLQNQPGISKVQHNFDPKHGDVYLSFDFQNDNFLNSALYAISGNKKTLFSPAYLKIKKHRVKRFNLAPYIKQYMKRESIEIDPSISSYIQYVSTIQTPGQIKKVKAGDFTMNEGKTLVSQHFEIDDIINNRQSTGIVIRYD